MLPEEGEEFSARDCRRLFRALAVNLDVIYENVPYTTATPGERGLTQEAWVSAAGRHPPGGRPGARSLVVLLVDLVDNPERAASGALCALELTLQLLAHAVWVVQQCPGDELDHRGGHWMGGACAQ